MKEKQMQVFVSLVKNYFAQMGEDIVVDTPYLIEENSAPNLLDYTGVIGVSGARQGVVYVTASRALLDAVLEAIGEKDRGDGNMVDLVGEIANTISGNARTEFGSQFHISIPLVFKGAPMGVNLPKDERAFVIPIEWQHKKGEIVICLQD